MIEALHIFQSIVIFAAAGALIFLGTRHGEWRGGLFSLASLFIAVAINAVEPLVADILILNVAEPEMIPIGAAVCASVCFALKWRGSTIVTAGTIYHNRRFPMLVLGLLCVSVIANLIRDKHLWALFPTEDLDVRDLREFAQGMTKSFGHVLLAMWAFLFLKDKHRQLKRTPSPHEHLLYEEPWTRVGFGGKRRACYQLGKSGLCVKFYKPIEECVAGRMKRSIRRDIAWRRFNKFRNSSSEEVYIYQLTRNSLPEDWKRKLPEVCERVFHPDHGWGILETFYANPDGTAIIPYEFEIKRQAGHPEIQNEIYRQSRDFLLQLIESRAFFHEPGNFHVQFDEAGKVSLKLIDFEPESKTLIPLELVFSKFRQIKLRRKAIRYLAGVREKFKLEVKVETEIG